MNIYSEIEKELIYAEQQHPNYPTDIFKQLAIMQEEAGEVTMAVNDLESGKSTIKQVREELIQTAAMCVRMIENLREYENKQHKTNA
jgi:NTP pyrophosphatase (non-canonical NTP hydrolase)